MSLALGIALSLAAWASEMDISAAWCDTYGGEAEYVTPDKTRVDCLGTSRRKVAWEFDWASKWYQALGQALHYSETTGVKPGIVLIYKTDTDEKYTLRLLRAIRHHNLDVEVLVRDMDGKYYSMSIQ